jgi:hypothetical protein
MYELMMDVENGEWLMISDDQRSAISIHKRMAHAT